MTTEPGSGGTPPDFHVPDALRGPAGWPWVTITDESMREGLQIEDSAIPVDDRVRLLDALSSTGLRRIVIGSFVSPKWTPQMAHVDEVAARFAPVDGVRYTALALNQRGVDRRAPFMPPIQEADDRPGTLMHLCDVFVQRNANRTRQDELDAMPAVVERAKQAGVTEAQIGVNAAWGSNWLGLFSHDERMEQLAYQYDLWDAAGIEVTKVYLGDPMGWHMPDQVEDDLAAILDRWPSVRTFHLHLHNTRGMAPVATYSALRALDSRHTLMLDASLGGMAGCPYCGNGRAASLFPTEDLVYMLEELGYSTGVDLAKLNDAVALAEEVVGHALYGHVSKAGGRPRGKDLYAMDMPFIETLDEAQHFRIGPSVYATAPSPWKEPITSAARDDIERHHNP